MSKYVFKPYREIFPELFETEKKRIALRVKRVLAIEHIGSTAIPNLGGKGIIDIAIAVKKEEMEEASKSLQHLGYEFRPSFSTAERFYFIIDLPDPEEGQRRYHVHLTHSESGDWKGFLAFREYLRKTPGAVEEYAEMKKQAASQAHADGVQYRKIKAPMFEKVRSLLDKTQEVAVEALKESRCAEAIDFLKKHEDFSLFLLGNLDAHGPRLTASANSGNL